MEWWWAFIFIFGGLMVLLASGLPIAFSFLVINIIGIYFFYGGQQGLTQLILSIYAAVTNFSLLAVPMFLLMGEIMFQSGVASSMIDTLDKWMGTFRARLSLLAVISGCILAALTGVPMASAALLGRNLIPEMEKRGYKNPMIIGPILSGSGLAMLIPPSSLGVLLASLANISVAKILIGGIMPGLILALFYSLYIILRCRFQPHLAPIYKSAHLPIRDKIGPTLKHLVPLVVIVFLVIGIVIIGIATPTEAAASGAVGCLFATALNRSLSWELLKRSLMNSMRFTVMVLTIIAGSTAFSQMLAFSGASKGFILTATSLDLPPIVIVIAMQIICLILGCFMEALTILMICIPIFFPIIESFGMDTIWFGIMLLLNMDIAAISPPFGLTLFVFQGVAPPHVTIRDIYTGVIPIFLIEVLVLVLLLVFPGLTLFLVSYMTK